MSDKKDTENHQQLHSHLRLPKNVIELVAAYLSPQDLANMALAARLHNEAAQNNEMWRKNLQRDFPVYYRKFRCEQKVADQVYVDFKALYQKAKSHAYSGVNKDSQTLIEWVKAGEAKALAQTLKRVKDPLVPFITNKDYSILHRGDNAGQSIFHWARHFGHQDIINIVAKYLGPIDKAIFLEDVQALNKIITDPDPENGPKISNLEFAAKLGELELLDQLIGKFAINDGRCAQLLQAAAGAGQGDVVRYLVDKKYIEADFNNQSGYCTGIKLAILAGHAEVAKDMIALILDYQKALSESGDLHIGSSHRNDSNVSRLLQVTLFQDDYDMLAFFLGLCPTLISSLGIIVTQNGQDKRETLFDFASTRHLNNAAMAILDQQQPSKMTADEKQQYLINAAKVGHFTLVKRLLLETSELSYKSIAQAMIESRQPEMLDLIQKYGMMTDQAIAEYALEQRAYRICQRVLKADPEIAYRLPISKKMEFGGGRIDGIMTSDLNRNLMILRARLKADPEQFRARNQTDLNDLMNQMMNEIWDRSDELALMQLGAIPSVKHRVRIFFRYLFSFALGWKEENRKIFHKMVDNIRTRPRHLASGQPTLQPEDEALKEGVNPQDQQEGLKTKDVYAHVNLQNKAGTGEEASVDRDHSAVQPCPMIDKDKDEANDDDGQDLHDEQANPVEPLRKK